MRYSFLLLTCSLLVRLATAQPLSFNFQKVTPEQGLNMASTAAICEDKYGYIWLGTATGLNRYDGYGVKVYEHQFGDSTSLMPSAIRYAFCDSEGRLWISFMNGLMEYDYAKDCFRKYDTHTTNWITNIVEGRPHFLYVGTADGLVKLNTISGKTTFFDSLSTAGRGWNSQVIDISKYENDLYLATRGGLVVFNLDSEQYHQIEVPAELKEQILHIIAVSPTGEVWVGSRTEGFPIYRTTTHFDTWKKYPDISLAASGQNALNNLYFDHQSRLWASSSLGGISLYDPGKDHFRSARIEPWMPNGMLTAYMGRIYQDRKGLIWTASPKGSCYFNPDNTFFQTILPANIAGADDALYLSNTSLELDDGQIWLGTGQGLYLFDPATGQYQHYFNEPNRPAVLHSNAVTGLCLDRKGDLWICTSKGVNRLRAGSPKIEFLGQKDGLPEVITVSVLEASDGTIWVANFSDDGHCYLPPGASKFRALREHPVLSPYAGKYGHCILEDSRGWLWFGLDGLGLIWYDPKTQKSQYWERTPQNDSTLAGNYVWSLCEDPQGTIWAGTSMGLSAIDPLTFRFKNYDRARGLPTNRVTCVRADQHNRIWAGTAQGLLLLDSARQHVRQFDMNDGLPELSFVNLPANQLKDGRFLFPTRRGFVLFDPEDYSTQQPKLALLLSGVRVFNQPFATKTNYEDLTELYLPPGKNFFSLEMTALNYANPRQTWYAYKMDPYDQNWTYTREHTTNYTNVPGGNYTFRYKATTDPNNWNVPEKTLRIRVGEHWYLSKWFWGMMALLAAALGYATFRRRARLREAFLSLERKAQALSKEKALVQYENLTQQLNPHFLFNSLASLGSLIRFDSKTASEFLEALSKMYRYILQSRDRETVLLHEEAAFAEYFLKLQKTRFGEALQVQFKLEASYRERKIVPVTLQNLLENALKHNTFDTEDPLLVDIFTENNYLVVRNNLQLRSVVETSNKQGLARLQSLYHYLTDTPMVIEKTDHFFIVRIPLL